MVPGWHWHSLSFGPGHLHVGGRGTGGSWRWFRQPWSKAVSLFQGILGARCYRGCKETGREHTWICRSMSSLKYQLYTRNNEPLPNAAQETGNGVTSATPGWSGSIDGSNSTIPVFSLISFSEKFTYRIFCPAQGLLSGRKDIIGFGYFY